MSTELKNISLPNAFKDLASVLNDKKLLWKIGEEKFQKTEEIHKQFLLIKEIASDSE